MNTYLISFLIAYTLSISVVLARSNYNIPHEQKDAYQITCTVTPIKNEWVYIGAYYAANRILIDSAWMNDRSVAIFKGEKKLDEGIYFFVTASKIPLFEFLVDEDQHFDIQSDSSTYQLQSTQHSPDNDIFLSYIKFTSEIVPHIQEIEDKLKKSRTAIDSTTAQKQMEQLNKSMTTYRLDIMHHHASSMLAHILEALEPMPEPNPIPKKKDGTYDTLAIIQYQKQHYWDHVDLTKTYFIHTPFFDRLLNTYINNYAGINPDSIYQTINYLLLLSRSNEIMHRYLLGKFTDKYIAPTIMGQDKVFVLLAENYFLQGGDTSWLNASQKKYIFDRYYSLVENQIGNVAPPLDLLDTAGKVTSLYSISAPFIVVCIWDPNCGHCKIFMPQLDSIYEANWKKLGIKIYAVNADEDSKLKLIEWKKFIYANHLTDTGWYNVYQSKTMREDEIRLNEPGFKQNYDAFTTPTVVLLDAYKRIIAKKISLNQMNELIKRKLARE